uniref:hypothetical protein n=1 Tax=Algoriphagus locisalis TaxID=305507 RepID=UPI000B843DB8|nr:hypothetical protein [Algoriphagus locisalis]
MKFPAEKTNLHRIVYRRSTQKNNADLRGFLMEYIRSVVFQDPRQSAGVICEHLREIARKGISPVVNPKKFK